MAYPHAQSPLFSEFKERLKEYGCEYRTILVKLDSPTVLYPVRYFERDIGDQLLKAVAEFEDNDRVEFSDIRRICRQLGVPTVIFGLELTDWQLDEPPSN